ncbi:MAG: hypothetical protein PHI60_05160, partial [Candidatus Omnitrophica bacterium]|nr:hypothetical protein [Candidatus Omnitrophota bacterium]
MKFKKRKLITALLITLLLLLLLKDAVIKTIVTAGLTQLTGAPVHIRTFSINFLSSSILAKGLKVYNPAGFPPGEILADIPNIELEYDRSALFKRRLHLP